MEGEHEKVFQDSGEKVDVGNISGSLFWDFHVLSDFYASHVGGNLFLKYLPVRFQNDPLCFNWAHAVEVGAHDANPGLKNNKKTQ